MRKFMLASTVVLFIVGQTMGASTVWMELELGGSNNGATCANPVFFTPGSTADGAYQLDDNGRLTWALRLHAWGTHLNASQQEVSIRGVANFVFDVELYRDSVDPANKVTTATFMSTANGAMTNCGIEQNWSSVPAGAAHLSNAAFTYVFSNPSNTNCATSGPGRAIDWWRTDAAGHKACGLRMDVRCYPKATGDGRLLGMGCGYSRWNKGSLSERPSGGVGRYHPDSPFPSTAGYVGTTEAKASGDSVYGWAGYGPLCEGQIEGLEEGVTYILRVVPGGGINVLRNEATSFAEVFAIAADDASQPDTITFTVVPPGQPVEIVGWSSVRDCGGVAMPLPLNPIPVLGTGATFTTETRRFGVQRIVVDFNQNVSDIYVPGNVVISNNIANDMSVVSAGLVNGGQSLQIDVTGGTDGYCYNIDITGTIPANKLAAGQEPNLDCMVQLLAGDVNGSGGVNTTDMAFVKSRLNQPVLPDNVRFDINCSGTINTTDMALVKLSLNNTAVCE